MKDSFAARPVVRSFRQMNEATELIVQLRQQQQRAEAALEVALQKTREAHAPLFMVETKNGPVAISERQQQLETAVSKFCERHGVHDATKPPATTAAASLSRFTAAGGIEFRDGHNQRTAAQALANKEGFRDAVNRLLKRFGLLGRVILKPELDWDGLKRSLRAGSLTPEEIAPLGMIWTGGPRTQIRKHRSTSRPEST